MTLSTLMVVDGLGLSGKTKALADLAIGLDRRRFRPTVLCFKKENSPLVSLLEQGNVPVVELKLGDGLSLRNLWQMVRLVARLRPDIVHCYNPRPMLYGGLAARLLRIRSTIGSLSAFACMVPDRDYDFLPQPLSTTRGTNRLRNRIVAKLIQRLAVVSLHLGQRFCRYNGISLEKLRLVPYGVRLGAPPTHESRAAIRRRMRAELGIDGDEILVGSVGRLVEQKDCPTQIAGFAAAAKQEPRLRMVLIGDGPLRAELERLAADLGVANRVAFLGYRADVADWLQAFDVFAQTSKFEPFGVAILEAKGFGVPIASSAVNEVPEILSNGRSGLLFEPSSPEAFARALLRLAGSAELRESLARQAYAEARDRHGLPAMIAAYEDLYQEVHELSLA
jgi:glycosyltransferase involved in cell wall biosynthesis